MSKLVLVYILVKPDDIVFEAKYILGDFFLDRTHT
jgi:hypothetical protein